MRMLSHSETSSENEIVSKLSRHFNDDIRTAIIIRNVKTFENLIELLDAFDQAGPSNASSGNNGRNLGQDQRSYPYVYGRTQFYSQNNFRNGDFVPNSSRNNFRGAGNFAQQNRNSNYNHGHGFAGQTYINDHFYFPNNAPCFEGHNHAPTSYPGTNQAHDNNRHNDRRENNYSIRPSGNGFVKNGVYHRRENSSPPNTAAYESGRSQGVSGQEGMRKVRVVANAPSEMQGRSNENLNASNNCEREISNLTNNVETTNNQGN